MNIVLIVMEVNITTVLNVQKEDTCIKDNVKLYALMDSMVKIEFVNNATILV
jgi:hypothetical protein